jgi:hypothetical protein
MQFPSPRQFSRVQWAVFGAHMLVVLLFVGGAATFVAQNEPMGAALQLLLALMFTGLGLTVARIIGRRG